MEGQSRPVCVECGDMSKELPVELESMLRNQEGETEEYILSGSFLLDIFSLGT